jgi:hypothetical protein
MTPPDTGARRTAFVVLAAGLAIAIPVVAGCGGGSKGSSVANLGTMTTSSTKSGNSAQSGSSTGDPVAFAHCMRKHGVATFPDPSREGGFDLAGIDRNSSRFQSASRACRSFAPIHSPAQIKQHVEALLAYARCMRRHGLPWFPDPDSNGAFTAQPGTAAAANWKPSSPQFQAADKACAHFNPGTG